MKPSALRRVLFQSLVFLMPVQLSLHFWPEWAYVFGIRVDYLSPTIYLTDLVLIALLVSWWLNKKPNLPKTSWALGLLILVSVNILLAQRPPVSFLKWLKVLELSSFVFYLSIERDFRLKDWLIKPLSWSLIFFSLVASFQLFNQKTLGGFFYFLGERTFDVTTPGIALFSFLGRQFLRPYSTFPHPNALAGFMLASLFLLGLESKEKRNSFIKKLAVGFAGLSVLISVSHGAWLSAFLVATLYLFDRRDPSLRRLFVFVPLILATLSVLSLPFLRGLSASNYPEEVGKRLVLSGAAARVIAARPLFGTGLGNFVVRLSKLPFRSVALWWRQPVHNLFLLVFAETGFLGLAAFLYLLFETLKRLVATKNKFLIFSLLTILLTGAVDHYWLTLQQNQLLFSLLLGLSFRKSFQN